MNGAFLLVLIAAVGCLAYLPTAIRYDRNNEAPICSCAGRKCKL